MFDIEPSEEQALIIETVRQFATNEIRPASRPCDEKGEVDAAILTKAHELGLVANALPAEHGGGGERSAVTGCLIAEELAWGDLSLALAVLSPALLGLPVADFGSDDQKRALLPALVGGRFTPGSLAITEPRFDSDPFRPQTRATARAGEIVLDGGKSQVPWLPGTQHVLVSAQTDQSPQLYLVPANAAGLTTQREQNMGARALPMVELELRGVKLPASSQLGGAKGCDLRAIVNRGRVALAAAAVGVARASFEVARDYAKERHAFGVPIATKQAIAFKLADMATEIDAARMLVWEAAWLLDQGADVTREAALAKLKAQRTVLAVADGAVQVFGGHGYIRDYLPEMHLRNGRGFACFEALALL